jgi:hypothetical protein
MEKQPYEWEEEDIQRLIDNSIKESTYLDYKRCDSLLERNGKSREKIILELSKDVSSFANAEGGTIVYGVIEEDYFPKQIDIGFDPLHIRREWLEDIIDSNVKPKIDGLKIKQVELNRKHPGKVIYVIYIPQSLQGAIQGKDLRYYQRRNFKSEPMEDYQIRDVMNRFKHPLLVPEVRYKLINSDPDGSHQYELILKIENKGVVTANVWGMDMLFPELYFLRIDGSSSGDIRRFKAMEKYLGFKFRSNKSSGGHDQILFPGEDVTLFGEGSRRFIYRVGDNNYEAVYLWKIHITIYADNMPPKKIELSFDKYQKF